ncbi:MAG: ACT domain-containing protein [Candidatus Micrarchaeia archaeon]
MGETYMKEITIRAENKVGALADVAELLGGLGVNIEAISAYSAEDAAIFRILTNDSTTAMKHLSKLPGLRLSEADIIVVDMQNRPGELGKITRKLSNKGVNLESVYIVGKLSDITHVAIKPAQESFQKAKDALGLKS